MYKLNNKGFTLIEVLAVVAIISIIGLIAVPNVLTTIDNSRQTIYDILVEDITIAAKQLFEELEFAGSSDKLVIYNLNGATGNKIEIQPNSKIEINLQTLISNGLLTGSNNPDKTGINKNPKILIHPITKEDMGLCKIAIIKTIDNHTFNTTYTISNESTDNSNCPSDNEYKKVTK